MKINLKDYPNFIEAYTNDGCYSWGDSLHSAGYRSANGYELGMYEFELDEVEFTWFVLRWS